MAWTFAADLAVAADQNPAGTQAAAATQRRPNVLLIVSDDQRPDTIAALGNTHLRTPHLDALVRRGTAFSRAVCPNPICTPSRAEILTGVSGFRNGVLDFSRPIDPQLIAWPRAFAQAGYRCGYVGKWHNNGLPVDHGFTEVRGLYHGGGGAGRELPDFRGRQVTGYRGWVLHDEHGRPQPELGIGLTPDISRHLADAAIALIERQTPEPFFLQVNFTSPHDPLLWPPGLQGRYDPAQIPLPANFLPEHPFDHGNFRGRDELLWPWPRTPDDVRQELACYYAVIEYMDQQIGRIVESLQRLQQLEQTIIVFTSDHGLSIGSHGLRGKQNMYDHTVGVPLVLAGPGVPANQRRAAQVYLRDLYPTCCQLTGVPVPESVEGRSLVPLLRGERQVLYPATWAYFRDVQRMIRTERWKLIRYPQIDRWQLFDLSQDPHELRDLSSDPQLAAVRDDLRRQLTALQTAAGDPLAGK